MAMNGHICSELVFQYCFTHGLNFQTSVYLHAHWGGAEEWEGVTCAGLDAMGTPFIIQEDDGRVKVVTGYADPDDGFMEDVWTYVTEDDLKSGKKLHVE